jgi:SAM-dependent methyltransferase
MKIQKPIKEKEPRELAEKKEIQNKVKVIDIIKEKLDVTSKEDFAYRYIYPAWSIFTLRPMHFMAMRKITGIEEGDRVLEIGGGYPFFKAYSGKVGKDGIFAMVDINKKIIEIDKKIFKNSPEAYFVVDAKRLPFQNESFDKVIFNSPKMTFFESAAKEAHRVLMHGGKIFITSQETILPLQSSEIKNKLEKEGFKELKVRPSAPGMPPFWTWYVSGVKP